MSFYCQASSAPIQVQGEHTAISVTAGTSRRCKQRLRASQLSVVHLPASGYLFVATCVPLA
jgi:hypothetical protein